MGTLGARLWDWIWNTDPGTWQGHLHIGIAGFWPGYLLGSVALGLPGLAAVAAGAFSGWLLVTGIFAYRESDNMVAAIRRWGFRLALRKKGLDGFMDFWMAMFGAGASLNLATGNFAHFVATYAASQVIWFFAYSYKKRNG